MATPEEKAEHGRRLVAAMARKPISVEDLAEALGVDKKTIGNWRNGRTMPSAAQLYNLERLLGAYNATGDPVEIAVRQSELTEDRQYDVIGFYKRRLREQREEATG